MDSRSVYVRQLCEGLAGVALAAWIYEQLDHRGDRPDDRDAGIRDVGLCLWQIRISLQRHAVHGFARDDDDSVFGRYDTAVHRILQAGLGGYTAPLIIPGLFGNIVVIFSSANICKARCQRN